jgi:splicing factor U2AF subunit
VTDDRSSSVVVLRGLTTREELMDPSEAEEIEKETALECAAFGEVREVRVVRPNPLGEAFDPEDVGFVFLRFADDAAAERARKSLHGRTFADRPVVAEFVRRGGEGARQAA